MAAADDFTILVNGRGGHGANPEETQDPIVVSVQIAQAIQTISSRNLSALEPVVISITQIHSGTTHNIIPDSAFINGTVRTLSENIKNLVKERIREICQGISKAFKCEVKCCHGL